jgi:hypothetical protein
MRKYLFLIVVLLLAPALHAQKFTGIVGTDNTLPDGFRGTAITVPVTPQQWGASVNDNIDDSAAINKMFRWMEANEYAHCVFPPGEYSIASNCNLPYLTGSEKRVVGISGYGAVLQTIANDVTIFDRLIPSTSGSPGLSFVPTIEGFTFRGQAADVATAGRGIHFQGSQNAIFRNMHFDNLNTAIEVVWCLNAEISNCNIRHCLTGIVGTNGDGSAVTIDEAAIDLTANTIDTDSAHGIPFSNYRVQVTTTDTLPGGVSASTDYYAEVIDSDTLALRTVPNGARVDITSIGVDSSINPKRIPNGSQNNSNSNALAVRSCRIQSFDASSIGMRFNCCRNLQIENCITEGSNVSRAVSVDAVSESGGVLKCETTIDNHWTEYTTSAATLFYFNMRQAGVTIGPVQLTTRRGTSPNETVFLDDGTSTESVFTMTGTDFENWNGTTDAWFDNNVPAAASRNSFSFINNRVANGDDWNDAGLWVNAVPTALWGRTFHTDADLLDTLP